MEFSANGYGSWILMSLDIKNRKLKMADKTEKNYNRNLNCSMWF